MEFYIILVTMAVVSLSIRCYFLEKRLRATRTQAADTIAQLHLDLRAVATSYDALERGANEQQEGFEQEYLSFDEAQETVKFHESNCLPWYRHLAG